MHTMKFTAPTRLCLLALALICATPLAHAEEERWYEIELIIFDRPGEPPVNEVWPEDPGVPDDADARRLLPPISDIEPIIENPAASSFPLTDGDASTLPPGLPDMAAPEPFRLLDESLLQLSADAARLTRAGHGILFHGAWRQPVVDPEQAPRVQLGDEPLPDEEGAMDPFEALAAAIQREELGLAEDEPLPLGHAETNPADELAAAIEREALGLEAEEPKEIVRTAPFEGVARLGVKRYLHLMVDLVIRREVQVAVVDEPAVTDEVVATPLMRDPDLIAAFPMPEAAPAMSTVLRAYRLRESRRMRSGSVHYLDHPAYGVLALATPFELPTPPVTLLPEAAVAPPVPGAPAEAEVEAGTEADAGDGSPEAAQ